MGGLIIKRDMTSVREQLTLKQDEFQSLVAKRLGMGDLKDLSPANLRRAEELAEKYLDIWEEADRQGDPLAQVDDALATLAREYHDLKKQIRRHPVVSRRHPLLLRRRPGGERPTTAPRRWTPRGAIHRPGYASPSTRRGCRFGWNPWICVPLAVLLIVGGFVGFLPVLGFGRFRALKSESPG